MGNVVRRRPHSEANEAELLPIVQVPAALRSLFDKPPLLDGEDPKAYWAFFSLIVQEKRPSDAIQWLWVRDIVNFTWEHDRLLRLKPALLEAGRKAAVTKLLAPVGQAPADDMKCNFAWDKARDYADKWAKAKTRNQAEAHLNKQGLNTDSIYAVSFSMQVEKFEAIERMSAALEIRRNTTLHEIEDRQQALRHALRQAPIKLIENSSAIASETA